MKTRSPRSSIASRNAASSAGRPGDLAQPRGLPTKTWNASQPSSSALARAPSTRPLPTRTWVPRGLRMRGRYRASPGPSPDGAGSDHVEGDRGAAGHLVAAAGGLAHHEADADEVVVLLDVDVEPGVLERGARGLDARSRTTCGTLDQLGPLRDGDRDGLAAEEGAAGRARRRSRGPSSTSSLNSSPTTSTTSPRSVRASRISSTSLPTQSLPTWIGRRPLLTRRSTEPPGRIVVPALGTLPSTVPSGTVSEKRSIDSSNASRTSSRASWAWSSVMPLTFGTS